MTRAAAWRGYSALFLLFALLATEPIPAMAADDLIVLGHRRFIGHGAVSDALQGDWLSAAFQTPVNVVEYDGIHLWRPTLEAAGR